MKTTEELKIEYQAYLKKFKPIEPHIDEHGRMIRGQYEPDTFGYWVMMTATDKQLRPALLRAQAYNKQKYDSLADTVWTPEGRVKINPEYLHRGKKLRQFQREQKESDPVWMADHILTEKLQNDPSVKNQICEGIGPIYYCPHCIPHCAGHRDAKYTQLEIEILTKKENKIVSWFKRKKKEHEYKRDLSAFKNGK